MGKNLSPLLNQFEASSKKLQEIQLGTDRGGITLDRMMAASTFFICFLWYRNNQKKVGSNWDAFCEKKEITLDANHPFISKEGDAFEFLDRVRTSFGSLLETTEEIDELIKYSKKPLNECTSLPSLEAMKFLSFSLFSFFFSYFFIKMARMLCFFSSCCFENINFSSCNWILLYC